MEWGLQLHGRVQAPQPTLSHVFMHTRTHSHQLPKPVSWAYSYLVPGHCGRWVAFNDSIKLCHVTHLHLYILNSDLHGRGLWERWEEQACVEGPSGFTALGAQTPCTSVASEALIYVPWTRKPTSFPGDSEPNLTA